MNSFTAEEVKKKIEANLRAEFCRNRDYIVEEVNKKIQDFVLKSSNVSFSCEVRSNYCLTPKTKKELTEHLKQVFTGFKVQVIDAFVSSSTFDDTPCNDGCIVTVSI